MPKKHFSEAKKTFAQLNTCNYIEWYHYFISNPAAQAVDIKMSGMYDFTAQWGINGFDKTSAGNNSFYQRIRTQIDIIASEALSGVMMFEIGDTTWGKSGGAAGRGVGGGISADGVSIEVKRAYLDWIVPQTDLKVRVGIQGFANPSFYGGSQVIGDGFDMAGISTNYQLNPTVGLSAWWFRPYSHNAETGTDIYGKEKGRPFDRLDLFGMSVPLTFDGVKVTPWAMYAFMGRDSLKGTDTLASGNVKGGNSQLLPQWFDGNNMAYSDDGQGHAWWAGLTGEVTVWNPFRFAWDFTYGSVDMGNVYVDNAGKTQRVKTANNTMADVSRAGWVLSAIAEYKLDMMTPGLFFWYGTGDDGDAKNGSERLPSIGAAANYTTFGFDGAPTNFSGTAVAITGAGTWGLGAQLKDISFVKDLKHTFRVAYYRGTNNVDMAQHYSAKRGVVTRPYDTADTTDAKGSAMYMTTKDSAWEFNLVNTYDIYQNLQLGVDLGYIKLNLSEDAWGKDVTKNAEDNYKIGVGLRYTF